MSAPNNLYEYYQQQGKPLPTTAAERFADPAFASAAQAAGYDANSYQVNMGNAGANSAILARLLAGGTGGGTQPPPSGGTPPPGGNTDTNQTMQDVFTPVDVGLGEQDPFINQYGDYLRGLAGSNVDEGSIRSSVLSRYQDQINATNRIYDEQLARARQQGLQDVGSGTAILARRGLAGSGRGMGIESNITTNNATREKAVDNERQLALSAIYNSANSEALAEAQRQREAKDKGATAYLDFLKTKEERINTAITGVAASLLQQGVKDFKSLEPSFIPKVIEQLQKIYGSSNITPDKISNAFLTAKKKKDADDAAAELEKQKLEIEKQKLNPAFTLGKGQSRYVYDKETGKYKLVGGGGGTGGGGGVGGTGTGGTYVPGANTVVDSWVNQIQNGGKKITDIPASQAGLRNAVIVGLNFNGINGLGKPLITELGQAAKTTAQDLLSKFDLGNTASVGKSALFNIATLPGTKKADFQNTFSSLKSQLALDGVKYLKGQGAVSDAERALLAQAVTKLNLNQSEAEFRKTLTDIVARLSGDPDTGAALPAPVNNLSQDEMALETDGGQPESMVLNGQTLYLQADGTYE